MSEQMRTEKETERKIRRWSKRGGGNKPGDPVFRNTPEYKYVFEILCIHSGRHKREENANNV